MILGHEILLKKLKLNTIWSHVTNVAKLTKLKASDA